MSAEIKIYNILRITPEELVTFRRAVVFTLLAEEREKAVLRKLGIESIETNDRIARLARALKQLEEIT